MIRVVKFMPLAFLAGQHGFPMFVSYLAVVGAVLQTVKHFRS